MSSQETATSLPAGTLTAGLEVVPSPAATVLNEHTNQACLCAVGGFAWPCEPIVLADHNLATL